MPHNDQGGFHTGKTPKRPFEHKLAGGNHRSSKDGCLGAALGLVGAGLTAVLGIAYGVVEIFA